MARRPRNSAPRLTEAERLIDCANELLKGRDSFNVAEIPAGTTKAQQDHALATAALSIRFVRLPAATRFRSIMEGWDRARIIRECY